LQLNYLDRIGQRQILVTTEQLTVMVDLVAGTVSCNGAVSKFAADRDAPIASMHRSILEQQGRDACDIAGGLRVVDMIDAVERAGRTGTWIDV